jgi:hypothetical protein
LRVIGNGKSAWVFTFSGLLPTEHLKFLQVVLVVCLESLSAVDRREYMISSRGDLDTDRKTAVRMENTMKERKGKRKTEGEHICEHEIERKGRANVANNSTRAKCGKS